MMLADSPSAYIDIWQGSLMIFTQSSPINVVCDGEALHHSPMKLCFNFMCYCAALRMVRFDNIGEDSPCSGIFVAGVTPLLLIACQSGIMIHRLLVDGAVTSMTSFSNVNCPQVD